MAEVSLPSGYPGNDDQKALEEVASVVAVLPKMAIRRLAQGPLPGESCKACAVLGGDPHPACRWLLDWHGNTNPVRCGILYGLALAQLGTTCPPFDAGRQRYGKHLSDVSPESKFSITDEAVERLAKFNYAKHVYEKDHPEDWEGESEGHRGLWLRGAREQLEVAAGTSHFTQLGGSEDG